MANNDSGGSFVLGFLIGGLVGAAVGLLIAPKSGQDTRAELTERTEAWRNRAEEMAANLRERVGPAVDNVARPHGPHNRHGARAHKPGGGGRARQGVPHRGAGQYPAGTH